MTVSLFRNYKVFVCLATGDWSEDKNPEADQGEGGRWVSQAESHLQEVQDRGQEEKQEGQEEKGRQERQEDDQR